MIKMIKSDLIKKPTKIKELYSELYSVYKASFFSTNKK